MYQSVSFRNLIPCIFSSYSNMTRSLSIILNQVGFFHPLLKKKNQKKTWKKVSAECTEFILKGFLPSYAWLPDDTN